MKITVQKKHEKKARVSWHDDIEYEWRPVEVDVRPYHVLLWGGGALCVIACLCWFVGIWTGEGRWIDSTGPFIVTGLLGLVSGIVNRIIEEDRY